MNNGAVTLLYDGDGNRVGKTVGAATTQYLVDDLNPTGYAQVVEELTNGAVTRRYTYGLQRISETQFLNSAWVTSFYGHDGFGSVRELTDPTGAVTDTYDFEAWGNTVNQTGSTPNVYHYRGEQFDPDLNLYYLRARYLNPVTGRFLTRDRDEACGCRTCGCRACITHPVWLHKYLYAAADPANRVDPRGDQDVAESALLIGAVSLPLAAGLVRYEQQSHALRNLGAAIGDLAFAAKERTTDEVRKYLKCLHNTCWTAKHVMRRTQEISWAGIAVTWQRWPGSSTALTGYQAPCSKCPTASLGGRLASSRKGGGKA